VDHGLLSAFVPHKRLPSFAQAGALPTSRQYKRHRGMDGVALRALLMRGLDLSGLPAELTDR
jgi:hypothetical protein